jgi:hypothetical protein
LGQQEKPLIVTGFGILLPESTTPRRIGFEENPTNPYKTIITIDLYNQGIATAEQLGVQIWLGSPTTGETQLTPEATLDQLVAGVENRQQLRIIWNNPTTQSRTLNIYLSQKVKRRFIDTHH